MTDSGVFDDLARASSAVAEIVERIPADRWTAPTPCTEWSVRDVVGHLVGMNLVLTALFEGSPMPERGIDRLGNDPADAYRRSADGLQAAARRPGTLEQSRRTSVGTATGEERLRSRIADLLVHGWDLAQATDAEVELPDDLVERALGFARDQLPRQRRDGRFAEPQPVPETAPAIDRLAAFTGRSVPWKP